MSERSTEKLLNVGEIAERLGVSPRTVWTQVAKGELPAPIRIGRLSRWRWDTILQWIEDEEAKAADRQKRLIQVSS